MKKTRQVVRPSEAVLDNMNGLKTELEEEKVYIAIKNASEKQK